jgi:hypothetical protein
MGSAEDIMWETIIDGINYIYTLYAEGKISKASGFDRLSAFLDSKGETNYLFIALAEIKNWSR